MFRFNSFISLFLVSLREMCPPSSCTHTHTHAHVSAIHVSVYTLCFVLIELNNMIIGDFYAFARFLDQKIFLKNYDYFDFAIKFDAIIFYDSIYAYIIIKRSFYVCDQINRRS